MTAHLAKNAGLSPKSLASVGAGSEAWLISRQFDLLVFGAPALIALGLVWGAPWLAPTGEVSLPWWVIAILGVDVAHVWATGYITYLSQSARIRWGYRLWVVPLLAWLVGWGLAVWSFSLFWRCLAYLAVFHFVRQQYGWVTLYHRKARTLTKYDQWLDKAVIYICMLYPLLWWHAHLPRKYHWFIEGDFAVGWVSADWVDRVFFVYIGLLIAFWGRQLFLGICGYQPQWGKLILVGTTTLCWGVGIITTNSDWAFTMTNVLIHGIPYIAFVQVNRPGCARNILRFYVSLVLLAYGEEFLWDRYIWHSCDALFGSGVEIESSLECLIMAVLATPQVTHYLLDGFIWRRENSASS